MARAPIKFEAGFPTQAALDLASEETETPSSSLQDGVQRELASDSSPSSSPRGLLQPIPASALEGLGMIVVGMVQIAIDGKPNVVPVGLAPFAGSDTVEVPSAGFFVDELGRCGILLNGNDGSWQKALPVAVEEARRALQGASAS